MGIKRQNLPPQSLQNQSHLKKIIFQKTLQLGEKKVLGIQMSFFEKIINFILDLIVRKKIKNQFGGKIKAFISGGGPLDYNVGLFLNSLGLPTLQGYGLTEASPVVSCNPINKIKIDTVGKIFKDVSVNIGRFGPYAAHAKKFYSLNKEMDPYTVTLEELSPMIAEKRKAKDERTIKVFEKEKIQLLRGPYGPYIKQGLRNFKLSKEQQEKVETLTIEEVNATIAELKANPPRKMARKKKAS